MESSQNHFVDKYGVKYAIGYQTDNDFVILSAAPSLYVDIYSLGLKPRRTQYYSYEIGYELKDNTLYLSYVLGEFRKGLKPFPKIYGSQIVNCKKSGKYGCDNPRMYIYEIGQRSSFSGSLVLAKDFRKQCYPKNDYAKECPFNESCYGTVKEALVEDGIIVSEKYK